ncbi:MAG: hypothetical protein RQ756_00155 [Flavobacteriaceae bacterium]|nr:hypothetical protein [Flavobacteriaceae bacterium]
MKNFEAFEKKLKAKLDEVQINPPKEAWENIKARLDQKRKKRITFWYRAAGVAALLLIGMYITQMEIKNSNTTNESITIEEPIEEPDNKFKQITQETNKNARLTQSMASDNTQDEKQRVTDNADALKQGRKAASPGNKGQQSQTSHSKTLSAAASKALNQPTSNLLPSKKPQQGLANLQVPYDTINENKPSEATNLTPETFNQEEAIADATTDTIQEIKKDLVAEAKKIQEEKEEKPQIASIKRWEIASSVSPVYYNNFGNGSSIGEEFANNSKENVTQVSVGIHLGYQIDKRWTIRAGFNKLSVGYDTQDIVFSSVSSSSSAVQQNVQFTNASNASFLNIHDKDNFEAMRSAMEAEGFVFDEVFLNGSLRQTISYFEIPVEARFQLLDRKFGIHLIGGFSSLILDDNELSMVNSNISSEIGRASNLNDWSFTANAGLGFSYGFNSSLRLQIEPTLKYQINPLSDNNGNFKPYILGVYSGLSYRF